MSVIILLLELWALDIKIPPRSYPILPLYQIWLISWLEWSYLNLQRCWLVLDGGVPGRLGCKLAAFGVCGEHFG